MKIKIFGKNIEVTEGIKGAVEEKLGKLDKYFAEETKADVTLSVNRNDQKVEVTIPVKGGIIRAEEVSEDMYASIDMVEETIERQLVKYKNKLVDKKKSYRDNFTNDYIEADYEDEDEGGHVAGGNLKGTSGHQPEALSGGGTAVSDPVHCPGKAGRIAGVFLLRNGSGVEGVYDGTE